MRSSWFFVVIAIASSACLPPVVTGPPGLPMPDDGSSAARGTRKPQSRPGATPSAAAPRAESSEGTQATNQAERDGWVRYVLQLRNEVERARAEVERLEAVSAGNQVRLERLRPALAESRAAVAAAKPRTYRLMAEVTGFEGKSVLLYGAAFPETGDFREPGALLGKAALVLRDPRQTDFLLSRQVMTSGVHFLGHARGVNGFGGPVTANVYAHAGPSNPKLAKAQKQVAMLEAQVAKLEAQVRPLVEARAQLRDAEGRLQRAEAAAAGLTEEAGR